jgi:hypothetical protein
MLVDAVGRPLRPGTGSDLFNEHPRSVTRSVTFKLNLGNYQSMDFFCNQTAQCLPDEVDRVSVDLYDWCYAQVMASVRDVQEKQARKQAAIERKKETNHEGSLHFR